MCTTWLRVSMFFAVVFVAAVSGGHAYTHKVHLGNDQPDAYVDEGATAPFKIRASLVALTGAPTEEGYKLSLHPVVVLRLIPTGDFDEDGDIDSDDFESFSLCFTGPGGVFESGCHPGDFNHDGDIDCHDWVRFYFAWSSGPPPDFATCSDATNTLTSDRTYLYWSVIDVATDYDLVQGDLHVLRNSGGHFQPAVLQCMADNHPGTSLSMPPDPEPGEGHWFLIRGVAIEDGSQYRMTYDSGSGLQEGERDSEIDDSPAACP